MKSRIGWLTGLALTLIALLAFASPQPANAVPSATNLIRTVSASTSQCGGSLLSQTGLNGNLCWSGSGSSSYAAFSATAMQNGVETYPEPLNGTPTLVLTNDTASTTVSLQLVGTMGTNTPITCQGGTGSTGCSIAGPLGTFGGAGSASNIVSYGPGSTTAAWPAQVTITFYGVAVGGTVGLQWSGWTAIDESGVILGGTTPTYGNPTTACTGGGSTTVSGVVYVPNGRDPLPNALIYVPSTYPGPLTPGVQCVTQANQAQGNPVTFTYSNFDGTFTLKNVPVGANIPIVIQSGKWRIMRTLATVTSCANTPVASTLTSMPPTQYAGDIPKIALVTGKVDAVECVLRKTGLADSEFTDPTGKGRINFYLGKGASTSNNDGAPGSAIDGSTPNESQLFAASSSTTTPTNTNMDAYDMIMFPCQGAEYQQPDGDVSLITQWTNAGGRLFTTHYSYVWLFNALNGNPWDTANGPSTAATWDANQASPTPDPGMATVDTSFSSGSTLANWLQSIGSSTTLGQIQINTLRLDQSGVVSPTQSWLTLNTNNTKNEPAHPVMQMTFNTPVGADGSQQCGRVLFNDYHVYNQSDGSQMTFPAECNTTAMTPQEHLLEYALFDLTRAVVPVTSVSASLSYVNTPATLTQGDTNDNIAITVTDTSTSVNMGSGAVMTNTLPIGVTVNTSSWSSNGWNCVTGAGGRPFTCTSTAVLNANSSNVINVPVQVAGNAPVGNGGLLASDLTGGGLQADVTGTDVLPIQGGHSIWWVTPSPITYGTGLSATQLNAAALCNNTVAAGTYAYTYNGAVVSAGTVLPAGNDTLTVTFTPTTTTTTCPAQTTSVVQVVNPAPLTVTANSKTMPYGGPLPALDYAMTGFVNNDGPGVVGGSATLSTTATAGSTVGTYPITFATTALTASNYTFNYVPGTLTVQQASGAITWPTPNAISYGTPLSATQLNAAATCNGQTVPGSYSYSPVLGAILAAGTQTLSVTFTPTDTADCPVEKTTMQLVVNPAVLTVTADNKTMPYGGPLPSFTDRITGFVNSDGPSVVSGTATMTTTATTSPAGAYPISFATKGLTAANYTFNYVPGTLTVQQASGAITWPTPNAIPYGTPLSATQLNAAATCNGSAVPGTYTYTPAAGAILNAGTYTLNVTFTPTNTATCPVQTASVQLVVNPLPTTTVLTPSTLTPNVGQPVTLRAIVTGGLNETGMVTFTAGGKVLCTAALATSGTATCSYTPKDAGSVVVTATYSGDNNNLGSSDSKTLKICDCGSVKASVTLTADQTQLTYPGQTNLHACVNLANNAYPQGTISFYDGSRLLQTVAIATSNDCVSWYITPGLNVGNHTITAVFTDKYGTKTTSNLVVITVTAAPVTMEASCWSDSFPYGGNYQCDANMDSGTKYGYMTYTLDGGTPVKLPLNSDGHTWFTIKLPPVGNHTVVIAYPAQGNFQGAVLAPNNFTVTPAPVQVQLVPSIWAGPVGTDFKLTATVASWSAGAPNNNGTITFWDGAQKLGKVKVDSKGTAKLDAGRLCYGYHNITATYANGTNYDTGSTTITVQVYR